MRAAPQILTGTRPGRDGRVLDAEKSDPGLYARISALMRGKKLIVDKAEKTDYEILFASKNSHHMVQVTAPEDERDPKTGRKRDARPIRVTFNNGLYSVPKKYNPQQAADIVAWLRGHANFKTDFWEQQDMVNEARILKTVRAIEAIKGDDATRETVLEFLTSKDFVKDEQDQELVPSVTASAEEVEEDEEVPEDVEDQTGDEPAPSARRTPSRTIKVNKKKPGPKPKK